MKKPCRNCPKNNCKNCPVKNDGNKYFLSYMGMEKEVTKQEYMDAERRAGFRSKFEGEPATASFGSGEGVNGRIEYV